MVVPVNILGMVVDFCGAPEFHGGRLLLVINSFDEFDDALHILEVDHHSLSSVLEARLSVFRRRVLACSVENLIPHVAVELRES